MTTKVKRNTYYKRQPITKGIPLHMEFRDLTAKANPTAPTLFTLQGGVMSQSYILQGTVADQPNYGDGELIGGFLSLKNTSVEIKNNRDFPKLGGYRIDPDIESAGLASGAYFLANISGVHGDSYGSPVVGDRLTMVNSLPVGSNPYLFENFEGISDVGTRTLSAGNAVTRLAYPRISESNLKQLLEDHDMYTNEDDFARVTRYLRKVKLAVNQDADFGTESYYALISSEDGQTMRLDNNIIYESTNSLAWRNALETFGGALTFWDDSDGLMKYKPLYYDFNKQELFNKNYVDYAVMNTSTADMDNNTQGNQSNTIFSTVANNLDNQNPYGASAEAPLITSLVDLSPEKSLDGGQSIRFYHLWDHAPDNNQIQFTVGGTDNLNPTCTYASIFNLPMPTPPFDCGMDTYDNTINVNNVGNMQSVIPEIRMAMNISKLGPNVAINGQGNTGGTSTDISGAISFCHENIPALGNGVLANNDLSHFENSFLRSICVTFSNYKPKADHHTVDDFITYGLERFHNGEDTENIVGGVVFTRFDHSLVNLGDYATAGGGSASQAQGTSVPDIYAFPIPVTDVQSQVTSSNGFTVGNTLASGGIAKLVGKSSGNYKNLNRLIWGNSPVVSGTGPAQISMEDVDGPLRFVKLPADSWFDMRIFTDIQQDNSAYVSSKVPYAASSSANPTEASISDRGIPMRIIFDLEQTEDGVTIDSSDRYKPFLDIWFPQGVVGGSTPASYPTGLQNPWNFADNPHLYPKHMTVWVQNYPWYSGNTDGSVPFFTGDNVSQGNTSGSSQEVELFIDSISLHNYGPGINSFSAANGNALMAFAPKTHKSPMHVAISGATSSSQSPKFFNKRWVGSAPVTLTGQVQVTNASNTGTLVSTSGAFDLGALENMANKTTGLAGGSGWSNKGDVIEVAGTSLSNTFASIEDKYNFTMFDVGGNAANYAGSTGIIDVTFTTHGTLQPSVNKADMSTYDVGQNVCIGLNERAYLPLTDAGAIYTSEASGNILFNDFNTQDYDAVKTNPLIPRKIDKLSLAYGSTSISGGAFMTVADGVTDSVAIPLGGQMGAPAVFTSGTTTGHHLSGSQFPVNVGTSVGNSNAINVITGSINNVPTDGFRQKGFLNLRLDGAAGGSTNRYGDWVKRENIAASTRIIGIPQFDIFTHGTKLGKFSELNSNQIKVHDSSMINWSDPDETYIIYLAGATNATSFKKTGLQLAQESPIVNNVISFKEDLFYADDDFTALVTEENLPRLLFCPEKFWMTMTFDTPASTIRRTYSSACMIVSDDTVNPTVATCSGTTVNEWLFSMKSSVATTGGAAGLYSRAWNIYPGDESSSIITNQDFGYGVETDENAGGGYVVQGQVVQGQYMHLPLRDVSKAASIEPGADIPMILYPTETGPQSSSYTFTSPDSTSETAQPTLFWQFQDLPPVISNLEVNGPVSLDETNLYNLDSQNLNSLIFTWNETNADDTWYRMLITSNDNVNDKYAHATMWAPLNEGFPNPGVAPTGYKVHNPVLGTSGNITIGSTVRPVIYGQGGWAAKLDKTTNGSLTVPNGTNTALEGLTEFTFVAHATFDTDDKGNKRYVAAQLASAGASAAGNFRLYKDTSNKINVELGADIAITGSQVVTCDGEVPTSIIVTMNSGSANDIKCKLYVDGALAGSSTGSTYVSNTGNDFFIGGKYSASHLPMEGYVEEFIIYNKEMKVIEQPSRYVYNSVNLLDIEGTANISHTARLFVADYHNFRGSSKHGMGMSNAVSWRATTV